ncbi:MAG: apolipoprotein N-acyltransferase, partial [Clostridia bacterium]|nr:apolipoprotein N-acyltransferase [Clostridia bacterium]
LSALVLQFGRWLPGGPLFRSAGFACLWVVHEWLCTLTDMAFPWSALSMAQTGFTPLLQTASLFGPWGITFAVVCVSCLLGQVLARKRIIISLSAAGTLLSAVLIAGLIIWNVPPSEEGTPVRAALLQGNAATDEKWDTEAKTNVLETYLRLANEAGEQGAEWIVLPESAVAANFTEGGQLHELYAEIAKKYGATVFAGILQTDENGVHNGFVAVLPDGRASEVYEKQHLVPFGEHLPFGGLLNKLFPSLGNLGLGGTALVANETEPVIHAGGTDVGCYLCYDAAFPCSACGQAQIAVVATNDSWFDKSGPMLNQSLRFARVRAVETGKCVLRAANTGISAFIDAKGTVLEQTEAKTETVLYGTVSTNLTKTLYARIGNAFVAFCGGLLALLIAGKALTRIRRRR